MQERFDEQEILHEFYTTELCKKISSWVLIKQNGVCSMELSSGVIK